MKVHRDPLALGPLLPEGERRIIEDHAGLNMAFPAVETPDGPCFLAVAEKRLHEAYLSHVIYRASDRGLTTTLDPRYARQEESLGWDLLCSRLEVIRVPGDHTQIIDRPNVDIIAEHLGVVFGETPELAQVAELNGRRHHDASHRFRRGADRPNEKRRDVAL